MNRIVISILYFLFTFIYLYHYNADMMAIAQNVLSKGITHYNPLVGAIIITSLGYLLQMVISSLIKTGRMTYAITFIPSITLISLLCDLPYITIGATSISKWITAISLSLVISIAIYLLFKKIEIDTITNTNTRSVWRSLWINSIIILFALSFLIFSRTQSEEINIRMKVESNMIVGNFKAARELIKESKHNKRETMIFLAYMLSREKCLADSFFTYPIPDGITSLNPDKDFSAFAYSTAKISEEYNDKRWNPDFKLIEELLKKNHNNFTPLLVKHYRTDTIMPVHFAEASSIFKDEHPKLLSAFNDSVFIIKNEAYKDNTATSGERNYYSFFYNR